MERFFIRLIGSFSAIGATGGLRGALASRSERCRFTERPLTVRSTFEKLPCNVGTYGGHHVREGL